MMQVEGMMESDPGTESGGPEETPPPDISVIVKREPDEMISEPGQWSPSEFPIKSEPEPASPTCADSSVAPVAERTSVIQKKENVKPKESSKSYRRKTQLKLKFHHQALPQEYVERATTHSEHSTPASVTETDEAVTCERVVPTPSDYNLESLPNESIKSWLQRITTMQHELQKKQQHSDQLALLKQDPKRKSASHTSSNNIPQQQQQRNQGASTTTPRIVNYRDLPYMGEMTLDNCKPRRGRKPKKADICHLIYKNYGTIIPGSPQSQESSPECVELIKPESLLASETNSTKTDIQNRIISSLLERRLTQESRKNKEALSQATKTSPKHEQEEPLNLCIRDLNQLKIRLLRRHDNVYEPQTLESVKTEPHSDDEVEIVHETKSTSSKKSPDIQTLDSLLNGKSNLETDIVAPGGYVFWPNAGVFVHPMALQSQMLYYQKLAANNNYVLPNPNSRPSSNASSTSSILPKKPFSERSSSENSDGIQFETKPKRTSNSSNPPTKRKRSAIFIPPIPTENQTNPATEVSICKFKFTGGAKPSLQEKKMLSVDSGGNFRYYSGTGDKSMRGYEFFPREALQQQAVGGHTSSSGVFLNASGEKIPIPPHLQESTSTVRPDILLTGADALVLNPASLQPAQDNSRHKKRKTRKSIQREKLEQTFKEKGFLIQTQQLESAEGATYCKFRQLRKFTRYLFRSWKDYLPGSVRDMQIEGGEKSDEELYDNALIENPCLTDVPSAEENNLLIQRTASV